MYQLNISPYTRFSPTSLLKGVSSTVTSAMAINSDNRLRNTLSNRNCLISCLRPDPTTLRRLTSFARLKDRAVLRFMKLMDAITSTKQAMTPNITR